MNVSSESTREETNGSNESQRRSQFLTSTLSVPPLAADIALNIFRLAPFDTMMGSVTYKAIAIEFLCEAYDPLKRFHQFLIRDRISNRTTYGYPHTSEKLTLFIAIVRCHYIYFLVGIAEFLCSIHGKRYRLGHSIGNLICTNSNIVQIMIKLFTIYKYRKK